MEKYKINQNVSIENGIVYLPIHNIIICVKLSNPFEKMFELHYN